MTKSAVERAVRAAGGQGALARAVGISIQAVHQWVKKGRVPAQRVLAVEAAAGGKVSRHELRPDLYPRNHRPRQADRAAAAGRPGPPRQTTRKDRSGR